MLVSIQLVSPASGDLGIDMQLEDFIGFPFN